MNYYRKKTVTDKKVKENKNLNHGKLNRTEKVEPPQK
jgi:hypothetical protein